MMNASDIAFPNLHIYLKNVPKNFTVFGFTIALYGVVIACGILLGLMLADYDRRSRGLDGNTIWDVAMYGVPFGIIGARIYYVIFYWDSYKDNPLSIFNLRQGGLAIYGGVIGAIITVYVYARIKKESFFEIFDSISLGFLVGQSIGRWGNFFNREVFGGYSSGLLAMRLPIEAVRARDISPALAETIVEGTNYIQVHPTFLYESLWNLALLAILFFYRKKRHFPGEIFCLYITGYGIGRFWIEYIRTDRLYIGNTKIPVSMVVSVGMILAAGVIAFIQYRRTKPETPQVRLEDAPDSHSEDTPDSHPEDTPDNHSEDTPDSHSEDTPDNHSEDTPDSHSEDTSDSHPEQGEGSES